MNTFLAREPHFHKSSPSVLIHARYIHTFTYIILLTPQRQADWAAPIPCTGGPRPRARGSQTKSEDPRARARLPDQERGSQTKSEAPRPRARLPDQERGSQTKSEAPRPRARLPEQERGSQTKSEAPRARAGLPDQERGSQTKSEAPRARARLPDQERGSQTKSEAPRARARLPDQERGSQIKSEAPRPRAYSWRNYRKGVLEECLSRSGGINRSYGKLYPTWLRYDSKLAGLVRFSYEHKLSFMCINQGKQISWLAGLIWTDS